MPFTLKDFSDIRELAKGGMGKIYLATQVSLSRKVVIKEMAAGLLTRKNEIKRFENEARAAAALNHDNIIRVYDFGEEKGFFYIAMEFIDGPDLDQLLKQEDFPREIGMMILQQALKGLAFAHEQGTVHRDVKPANMLISNNGAVKMADFGLAYAGTRSGHMTATGSIVGTPVYMSPELVNGKETKDRCMDIWAVGIILYRIVTGEFPFTGDNVPATLISIVNNKEQPAEELDETLPPYLAELMHSCLEKDHTRRLQSLAPLIEGLKNYFFEIGVRDPVDIIRKYLQDKRAALEELDSLLVNYHIARGSECAKAKKYSAAQAHYQEARKRDPKNREVKDALRLLEDHIGNVHTNETITVQENTLTQVRTGLDSKKVRHFPVLAKAAIVFLLIAMAAGSIAVFQGDTWETMTGQIRAIITGVLVRVSQPASNTQGKSGTETSAPAAAQLSEPMPTPVRDSGSAAISLSENQITPSVEKKQEQQAAAAEKPGTEAAKPPAQGPDFSSGVLRVEVKPSTASVLVDDTKLTPEEMAGVKLVAGVHRILARADGFAPSTTLVAVSGNDTHLVMIGLSPVEKTGELEVLSDLAAEMYIDGVYRGSAPTAAPILLSEGQHTVVFKRLGYKPYVKMVSIRQGETKKIKVESGSTSSR
jgi:serine/threonine protein kinase